MTITSKLIDGTYPDYRRIIRPATATATVARKALADAVGRCMPLCQAAKTHAPIDLVHDTAGELVVRVNGADGAEIEDRIDIEGSQFAISLGGSMLAATLASFDGDTIEIGLTGIGDNIHFGEPGKECRTASHCATSRQTETSDRPDRELHGRAGGMTKEEAEMDRFIDTIENFGRPERLAA